MFYFFPRGNGPLVSILLPTRGRPKDLVQSIDSLWSLAEDKSHLEFILKVDDDDSETIHIAKKLESMLPMKTIVSPKGLGFRSMHLWVNEMCSVANGEWVIIWNDDARMRTEGWDNKILRIGIDHPWIGINDICVIEASTINRPFTNEFFFVRRKMFEILGHFSLSPHNDTWMYSITRFLDVNMVSKIQVDHFSHLMTDKTREESEGAYKTTIHSYNSLEASRLRALDLNKLLDHMEKVRDSLIWLKQPSQWGWYWLRNDSQQHTREMHHVLYGENKCLYFDQGVVKSIVNVKDVQGEWAFRCGDSSPVEMKG